MGRGRHGAARPPMSVLIRQDRADFGILLGIVVLAVAVMALTGWAHVAFWLALVLVGAGATLIVRRIMRLARSESQQDDDLL
ncbi:hypothetical protein FHX37_0355 [Haloactinospora alba]|uniref:Uncharacterized protein n=2 Tax=Haloactinospora alba TaxID=405555 RepID=A0A543NF88_9ACTN|nr:hypothetical protein FHX37_0355 [Haloactinospora alba]